jgi:hypothetical protein
VRKTLNQVDQKLINARFLGIGPGMFGLVQGGWIDASVAENSAHWHVIVISLALHPFFPFLSDAWTTPSFLERKSKNGAFRYGLCSFVP